MAKTLKIWNGRGFYCKSADDLRWSALKYNEVPHAYVAAFSRADACRVIGEYCGKNPPDSELKDYWIEGSWGNSMSGIVPERGLWLQFGGQVPVRVAPKKT